MKLFNRERQRLVITEAGRDYLEVVRDAFDRIAAGTERLLQRQSAGVLTVTRRPISRRNGSFIGSAASRGRTPQSI